MVCECDGDIKIKCLALPSTVNICLYSTLSFPLISIPLTHFLHRNTSYESERSFNFSTGFADYKIEGGTYVEIVKMDSPFIYINHSICMILETFHMFNHGV